MTETEVKELKERLERAEMINETTCSALERAIEEITKLNAMLAKARNQSDNQLHQQIDKMQKEIEQLKRKQTDFLSGKQPQRYF